MIFPLAHLVHLAHTIHDIFGEGDNTKSPTATAEKTAVESRKEEAKQIADEEDARRELLVEAEKKQLQNRLLFLPLGERIRAQSALNSNNPAMIHGALARVQSMQIVGPNHELHQSGDREREGGNDGFGR